ncbi:MAG: tRNA 2-thiouridine synthesizing protein E [Candidatus Pseudothioglobus sp.]
MITLKLDSEGFLKNMADWSPAAADELALQDNLTLTPAHWEVINVERTYYQQFNVSPPARVLVKIVRDRLGTEKGRSIYLMQLFGGKPARLVAKLAGLPKPDNCD